LYRKSNSTGAELAYLGHACLDTKSRVVLATAVTKAHTSAEWDAGAQLLDEANTRVGGTIEVVSADAGYGVDRFLAQVEARGLEAHIPVRGRSRGSRARKRSKRVVPHVRPEQQRAKRLGAQGRERAIRISKSRAYRISRKLRLRIEHLFGEAKTCHGLGRARYRGLEKVARQMTLTAVAINLKRLAVYLGRGKAPGNVAAVRVEEVGTVRVSAHSFMNCLFNRLGALFCAVVCPHHEAATMAVTPR
jgi:IS5 family transposase